MAYELSATMGHKLNRNLSRIFLRDEVSFPSFVNHDLFSGLVFGDHNEYCLHALLGLCVSMSIFAMVFSSKKSLPTKGEITMRRNLIPTNTSTNVFV